MTSDTSAAGDSGSPPDRRLTPWSVAPPSQHETPPSIFEYLESLLAAILMTLFLTTFVVQSFQIPSESMEPALLVGDYLLVNKFVFGGRDGDHQPWYERALPYRDVRRGEVIVFKYPYDDHPHYVKRVIGLPGDRIRITDQALYINGFTVLEPYVVHDASFRDPFGDNFPPAIRFTSQRGMRPEWAAALMNHVENSELVVPPHSYFVMGDNRDHSWDSRYWGFVDRGAIIGRPVFVYWSRNVTSTDYVPKSSGDNLRYFFRALWHIPSRTRWRRLLREVH